MECHLCDPSSINILTFVIVVLMLCKLQHYFVFKIELLVSTINIRKQTFPQIPPLLIQIKIIFIHCTLLEKILFFEDFRDHLRECHLV